MNTTTFRRRLIRLRDFDYSEPGAYFVTICTQERKYLFGEITDGGMRLNGLGKTVTECWNGIPRHFANVETDTFVVMPNHVRGIIMLTDTNVGAGFPRPLKNRTPHTKIPSCVVTEGEGTSPLRRCSLGQIVAYFKYQTTKRINEFRETPGIRVWQRNYYEHVIRNENELSKTRQYIQENPLKWDLDPENPKYEKHPIL